MNVSSLQSQYTLFESREHTSGCQCPGCCKGSSLEVNNEDVTKVQESNQTTVQGSTNKDDDIKGNASELTQGERQELAQLQQRDSEVRAHEAAHLAAGGSVVSGSASFTYQKGPDGRLYAIGGEVPISSSGGNTPEEKIAIAEQIQTAALAPANPSPQDLKVASSAAMMEAQARQELARENTEEQKELAVNTYEENQKDTELDKSDNKIRLQA